MSKDRRRARRGRGTSVAGDPADETLTDLVAQFADPYAFIRELIQNSLDAGASVIDVEMSYKKGELTIAVRDDGEGMDLETIEGYLLTLFRSTKEEDLTKIGKFGIGFVSLFAMKPWQVVVDTGRDAVWHRVVFHEDRSYTLVRREDPYEGTTVTLHLKRKQNQARRDCEKVRDSASKWCRYAEADINTSAEGFPGGWMLKPIRGPFTVDAPVVVEARSDGFHAVMGPSGAEKPAVGFYNHGLTLWESDSALLPGVTFRVKGRHLEHTLTRDNVIRDRHFEQVLARLGELARTKLAAAVHDAMAEAAAAGDTTRMRELCMSVRHHDVSWRWDKARPLVPRVGGPPVSIGQLEHKGHGLLGRLWRSDAPKLYVGPDDPQHQRIAKAGHFLVMSNGVDATAIWAARWFDAEIVPARERWYCADAADAGDLQPLIDAAQAFGASLGIRFEVHPASFANLPGALRDRLAIRQSRPFQVQEVDVQSVGRYRGVHVHVNVRHPLLRALAKLPLNTAAPLLMRALRVDGGFREALPNAVVEQVLEQLGGP